MNSGAYSEDKKFKVYCHINTVNNKRYIGITCQDLNQRFRNGKGYKSSPHFNYAINKYGWDKFKHEILFEDLTLEEAKEMEIELIQKYHTRDPSYGYNMTPGGEGYCGEDSPWFGRHHTEEAKKKMSEKRKGIPKSEEFKKYMSEKLKGRKFSDETRRKMSENHADYRGEKHPQYGTHIDPEHHKRMMELCHTPEAIAKMKAHKVWYSGDKNPNAKRVMCIETGKIYTTVNEAAADNGCRPEKISDVIHGRRKHTKNLHFKLLEKE